MTELKIRPIIMITRTDFLLITARFLPMFHGRWAAISSTCTENIFDLLEKFVAKTQATAPKKQILAKAVLANLETPAKPPEKKTACDGPCGVNGTPQINSGYVTVDTFIVRYF